MGQTTKVFVVTLGICEDGIYRDTIAICGDMETAIHEVQKNIDEMFDFSDSEPDFIGIEPDLKAGLAYVEIEGPSPADIARIVSSMTTKSIVYVDGHYEYRIKEWTVLCRKPAHQDAEGRAFIAQPGY